MLICVPDDAGNNERLHNKMMTLSDSYFSFRAMTYMRAVELASRIAVFEKLYTTDLGV